MSDHQEEFLKLNNETLSLNQEKTMTAQTITNRCDQLEFSTLVLGADERIRRLRVAVERARAMGLKTIPLMNRKGQPMGLNLTIHQEGYKTHKSLKSHPLTAEEFDSFFSEGFSC